MNTKAIKKKKKNPKKRYVMSISYFFVWKGPKIEI